jgi:hypothetical protein
MWWKARDRTRSRYRPAGQEADEKAEAVATYTARSREEARQRLATSA